MLNLFSDNWKIHETEPMSNSKTILSILLILGILSFSLLASNPQPVNPTTIPEYDSVAAVVMYWNPNNSAYDVIALQIIDGIQSQAVVYLQSNVRLKGNYGSQVVRLVIY